MFLLVIEKNRALDVKNETKEGFDLEGLEETAYAASYAILPSKCKDEEGYYSMDCVIAVFEENLENIMSLVKDYATKASPIVIIATPLPFTRSFLLDVFTCVEPYVVWASEKPVHSLEVVKLLGWLVAVVGNCPWSLSTLALGELAYDIFVKDALERKELDMLDKVIKQCLDTFREKVLVERFRSGVLIYQKSIEDYRVYLKKLRIKLEEYLEVAV